jgi:hypothetical protein
MRSLPLLSAFVATARIAISVALPEINADLSEPAAAFANYSQLLGDNVPQGTRIIPRLENQP